MFKFTASKLRDFITQGLEFTVDTGENQFNIIAVTGLTLQSDDSAELNDNTINYYNDTLFFLYKKDDNWKVEGFKCTAEPGTHYTSVNPNARGAAHLCFCRQMRYRRGTHKSRKAFNPADWVSTVWRDADGDFKLDGHEKAYTGDYGINIHSGGTTETDIGRWSAGCIAVLGGSSGKPWQRILELRSLHTRNTFKVQVVPGSDFKRWLKPSRAGFSFRPTVHIGSKGPAVGELQELIGATADNDFGPMTLEAFKHKQEELGVEPQPVCGPGQWERMLGLSGPYWDDIHERPY